MLQNLFLILENYFLILENEFLILENIFNIRKYALLNSTLAPHTILLLGTTSDEK